MKKKTTVTVGKRGYFTNKYGTPGSPPCSPFDEDAIFKVGRPPTEFTAFCQELGGGGTIWIDTVWAKSTKSAITAARKACGEAWQRKPELIHVLGLAQGNIRIVHWEDQNSYS